ncbi:protein NUCLEOLAR COMPLEX ASSOCIATED 4 [Citrus sinensis]|nr:protein NUCLEOLAR COMPLEX ASSOCIATED 4 [Citrus sinensis]
MATNLSKSKKRKHTLEELKTLGQQLLSSRAHINNLPLLLTFVSPSSPPQFLLESLLTLQSFFSPLLPHLPPSFPSSTKRTEVSGKDDPEFIYKTWLRSKFDEFVQSLLLVLVSPQSEDAYVFLRVHSTESVGSVTDFLASKYFKYIDVRYFTYISMEKLARSLEGKGISDDKTGSADENSESHSRASIELSLRKSYYILSKIPSMEDNNEKSEHEMWSGSGSSSEEGNLKEASKKSKTKVKMPKAEKSNNNALSAATISKKMKSKFTKAWITFLRLPLPVDIYKEVLVTLHRAVIPFLSNPIMLCDFLTRSYDIGGVVSVMALSSLFILMTQHGLEYPNFYEKLYALLVPSIFMAKHRAKFFELLDSCLRSPLLPAYLAAAFVKKLSRLSILVPPSGALVIMALIHNLLRRHPSINCLLHREDGNETHNDDSKAEKEIVDAATVANISSIKPGIDHFDDEESNPVKSNAMRSSLWEIDTLRHHYCPPVSRFVLSLENDLTVRAKTTEINVKDFCSGSYATIFGEEIRRRVKQVPLAFYKTTPTSLFSDSDFAGWTFICDKTEENSNGNKEKNFAYTGISDSPLEKSRQTIGMMNFPKRYLIVILTFISTCVCYIERVGFSIAYTAAADAAGVNQSSKGTILSTFYYGYACSQVPGGWAAQKIGGRKVLLFSFVLWSSTCFWLKLDPNNVFILVVARLLVGVSQGFIFPSIHTVLAQWVPPHERSRSVSLTTSGMYLGAAMGMLFLPSLVKYNGPNSVFNAEAALGGMWSLLWFKYATDPPRSEHPKASAAGFGESLLPMRDQKLKVDNGGSAMKAAKIPWKRIVVNLPVWAIVVNNFTFHYALYVLMNWLPTYFELGLQLSLQEMGSSKMMPYLNMFIFSNIGGVVADHLITKRILSVTRTRKFLNTVGFMVASIALMALPIFRSSNGAIFCSSIALGFLALGRAGFAVNHMDIAPRYAGIVMGISNTAGTLAGIVGVDMTGKLLEAAKTTYSDLSSPESWRAVFFIPGLLCILSSFVFLLFSTGERIFD